MIFRYFWVFLRCSSIVHFTSLTIFVSRTFWLNWLIVCRILWIQSPRNYDFPDPSIGWSCGPFAEQQSIGSSALSLLSMAHLWISLLINRISVSAPDLGREAGDMIYVGPGHGCSDPIFPRFLPSCVQSQVSGLQSPPRPSSRPIASSSWCPGLRDHFVLLQHSAIFPAPVRSS